MKRASTALTQDILDTAFVIALFALIRPQSIAHRQLIRMEREDSMEMVQVTPIYELDMEADNQQDIELYSKHNHLRVPIVLVNCFEEGSISLLKPSYK